MREVVVIGAGIAGLGAAIALSRSDCHVTLIEQDPEPAKPASDGAWDGWDRPGVPQALLPHGFVGLGKRLLQRLDAALFERMLAAGAQLIGAEMLIDDGHLPEDDALTCLACRRPLFELLMRQTAEQEPHVDFRPGVGAIGLEVEHDQGSVPVVRAVRTNEGRLPADLVVDAGGRRSSSWDWLEDAGVTWGPARSEPCGLIYYSRYFRLRPGLDYPPGRWLFGPATELPYLYSQVHKQDRGFFAITLSCGPWDQELKDLRRVECWERAARSIATLQAWLDPSLAEPVTGICAFGGLLNRVRDFAPGGHPAVLGWVPVGDSLCHTNAVFAWGVSLALDNALRLADLVRDGELAGIERSYHAAAWPTAASRYQASAELDSFRSRTWRGESTEGPEHDRARLMRTVIAPSVPLDSTVARAFLRRLMLLDDAEAIFLNQAVLARARTVTEESALRPRPSVGPSRSEMLSLMSGAGST